MYQKIFNILFLFGISFGVFFICYTFFYKKRRDITSNKLTMFLLTFTLNNIQLLLVDNFTTYENCYLKNLHPFLFFVFVVPYFHSFIANYLKIEKKVGSYLNAATVFFGIGMTFRILSAPFIFNFDCELIGRYVKIEEIFISVFSMFVFVKVIQIIYYKKELYENMLTFDKLKWIKTFLFFGLLLLLFWVFAIISNLENNLIPEVLFYYPLRIGSSALIYWVAYTASFQNVLTSERKLLRKKISNSKKIISTEENDREKLTKNYNIIRKYFDKTECYLNPDLTLDQLSDELNICRTQLSEEINNSNINFNNFVNSFRVAKAILLLKDPDYINYTIESIGLECGFNSKSTFYAAFRKVANTTPACFKKSDLLE